MHQIFLYILVSIYYSANIISAQRSTNERINFKQNCRQQLTVKQIQLTVENMLKSLATSVTEMNISGQKQVSVKVV